MLGKQSCWWSEAVLDPTSGAIDLCFSQGSVWSITEWLGCVHQWRGYCCSRCASPHHGRTSTWTHHHLVPVGSNLVTSHQSLKWATSDHIKGPVRLQTSAEAPNPFLQTTRLPATTPAATVIGFSHIFSISCCQTSIRRTLAWAKVTEVINRENIALVCGFMPKDEAAGFKTVTVFNLGHQGTHLELFKLSIWSTSALMATFFLVDKVCNGNSSNCRKDKIPYESGKGKRVKLKIQRPTLKPQG